MILLIDNYDSFSFNLYQLIGTLDQDIKVIRNDELTVEQIGSLAPSHIVVSPGPGRPRDAGVCIDVIKAYGHEVPILGVCLGHQAICEAYGATVGYAKELMHGKQSIATRVGQSPIFAGLPEKMAVARYHSLAAEQDTMPAQLDILALADDGEIMAVQHNQYPVYGVQFHPESILTDQGLTILKNFLTIQRGNEHD